MIYWKKFYPDALSPLLCSPAATSGDVRGNIGEYQGCRILLKNLTAMAALHFFSSLKNLYLNTSDQYRLKKIILLFAIFINLKPASAQTIPATFSVGAFLQVLPDDTIKVWYGCNGLITNAKCADYYRIAKADTASLGFSGVVRDYDMSGKLIFKVPMRNGMLNGPGVFYYANGQVKEAGNYVNDERNGVWKYYYSNGKDQKTFDFHADTPLIMSYFNSDGIAFVKNGNGYYTGDFFGDYNCSPFSVRGHVVNGRMDGQWEFTINETLQLLSAETYDKGRYLGGFSRGGEAYLGPKIKISGYYNHEQSLLDENHGGCAGDNISFCQFNSKLLVQEFYPSLIKKIKTYPKPKKQWMIVGLNFDKPNRLGDVNVYSSRHDTTLTRFVYNYIKGLRGWEASKVSGRTKPTPILFMIIIDDRLKDDRVLIPAEYKSRQAAAQFK